jgi:hypothetical protein
VLRILVGDGAPHPIGDNAGVRQRVFEEFQRMDYTPSLQEAFACNPKNTCAWPVNIVARLPGREPGAATLLAAHYDSVGAGPGAADDGMGVAAVLGAARALKADPPRHDVIFLITDGEEAGLLGARAFVEQHPWVASARGIVNLDTRGPGGPLIMLPSSPNAWLLKLYATAINSPATSSVFHTVFPVWRFGTDFSVFQEKGLQGFNLFVPGNYNNYHTPSDRFENASPETLQLIGESALALVRALANAGPELSPKGNAVFLDLLGWKTLWWREERAPLFAMIVLLLLIFEGVVLARRARLRAATMLYGFIGFPVICGGVFLFAMAMRWAPRVAGEFPVPWAAKEVSGLVTLLAGGFAVVGFLATAIYRRAGFWPVWMGTWAGWAIVASFTALRSPEGSYLFLLPAAAACVGGSLRALRGTEMRWSAGFAALFPAFVAAILWFPVIWFRYNCDGLQFTYSIALLSGMLFTAMAPLFAGTDGEHRWWIPLCSAAVALVAALFLWLAPAYSSTAPQRMNIFLQQDADTGEARWFLTGEATPLPKSFLGTFAFRLAPSADIPGIPAPAQILDAPNPALKTPELEIIEESRAAGHWILRLRLRSPRGAPRIALFLPGALPIESLTVAGRTIPQLPRTETQKTRWQRAIQLFGLPPEGMEIQLKLGAATPFDALIEDESPGLPPAGDALRQARSAFSTPVLDGDATIVTHRMRFAPAAPATQK